MNQTSRTRPTKNSTRSSTKPKQSSEKLASATARVRAAKAEKARRDPADWIGKHFRVEDTGELIRLERYQKAVLRYVLKRGNAGRFDFNVVVWSQTKKSGKTTVAGAVTQWAAETWGKFGEVLCLGNDADQAKERGFRMMRESLQSDPEYNPKRMEVPDRWKVGSKFCQCLSTGTTVKAIATDYKGEAGANPILTVWTELWGFTHKADLRFWAEMAPSPTRPNSIRWIETYAGYEGESELLWGLYEATVLNGRQVTAGELGDVGCFEEAPNPDDLVPIYVNEASRMVAFWDSGLQARRMPWQLDERGKEYYATEEDTQTPAQMLRLHKNWWVSAESEFIPIALWDACVNPLPLVPGSKDPIVVALDAAVSGDCFGLVAISRDPDHPEDHVAVRASRKWSPPQGGTIDFAPVEEFCRWLAENFNVVQFAYDPYQLHDFASRLMKGGVGWFREFSQGAERMEADKDLFTLITHRRIRHDGNLDLREHLTNANAKQSAGEDTRLRMVKKSPSRKIDLAVCLSMGASECLRLNL